MEEKGTLVTVVIFDWRTNHLSTEARETRGNKGAREAKAELVGTQYLRDNPPCRVVRALLG